MKDYKTIDDIVGVEALEEAYERKAKQREFRDILHIVSLVREYSNTLTVMGFANVNCMWFQDEIVRFFKRRGFLVTGSPGSYVIWLKKAKSL